VNRVPRWLLPTVLALLVLVVVIGAVVRLAPGANASRSAT
jgi:hypothetical protein